MKSKKVKAIIDEQGLRLTPRLRFAGFRSGGAWEQQPLSILCDRISQGGTPDTTNSDYWNGPIPWLTPAEMGKVDRQFIRSTTRTITAEGLKNCSSDLLPINSVVLSTRAPIGYLAITKSEMAINQGCRGLVSGDSLDHNFLFYSLKRMKGRLVDLGSGNTFKELSGSSLKGLSIPVSSLEEQKHIAVCLSSVDELIAAAERKLNVLKEHKKGLLQQLFPAEGETIPRLRFPDFQKSEYWQEAEVGHIFRVTRGEVLSMTLVDEECSAEKPYPVYSSQTKRSGLAGFYSEYLYENAITWTTDGANAGDVNYRSGRFYCTNVCGVLISNKVTQIHV